MQITRREILALGTAALLPACFSKKQTKPVSPPKQKGNQPNMVVFLSDALRADALGCYGGKTSYSPSIDAWAAESMLFERCYSQACWTKPSIGSIYTGMTPRVHRAAITHWLPQELETLPVQILRPSFVTLAEAMHNNGYHTALFLANPHVQREFGFAQGFLDYSCTLSQPVTDQVNEVIAWMEKAPQPFFVFIHAIDPHGPYQPDPNDFKTVCGQSMEESLEALPPDDKKILTDFKDYYINQVGNPDLAFPPMGKLTDPGRQYLRLLYQGEVMGIDRNFARLRDAMNTFGIASKTITLLIADHGEAFFEHKFFKHGNSLFNEEIHVPFIMHFPNASKGMRIPWTTGLDALHPSLVTLAGGVPEATLPQSSLFTREGKLSIQNHRRVFSDIDYYKPEISKWGACMIEGNQKIIWFDEQRKYAMFDLEKDPSEHENLLETSQAETPEIQKAIETFDTLLKERDAQGDALGEPQWAVGKKEFVEQLESIGYL